MRRVFVAAMLAMLGVLVLAPAVGAQVRGPSGADGSYNCSDFDTQEQAQAYYDGQGGLAGGDPDGLDADSDGAACEDSLPSGGGTTPPATTEQPTKASEGAPGNQQEQYQPPTQQDLMESGGTLGLPETGGASLLPLAGGALLAGGLFGMRLIRRR